MNSDGPYGPKTVVVPAGGVGFFGLLGILFIGLKLGGVISWSWWWVLAPLWGPLAIWLLFIFAAFALAGIVALIIWAYERDWRKKRERLKK